jgi:hypothetical protein
MTEEHQNFKICHLNVNSLLAGVNISRHIDSQQSKFDEIHTTLITEYQFDIIALSETWLDNSISDALIQLNDYVLYRRDRNRHGGGVLLYVNRSLPSCRRLDLEIDGTEMAWVEVIVDQKKVLICCCYRPPGQRAAEIDMFITNLQSSIDTALYTQSDHIFIIGDLNDRCVDWNDDRPVSELGTQLKDLVIVNNLYQIITEPTHFTDHSAYLLDVIITDSPGYMVSHGVMSPISNLHHLPVFAEISFKTIPIRKTFSRQVWHYKNANWEGLNTALSLKPFEFNSQDVNEVLKCFITDVYETCTQYIPNRVVKVRARDKPWMTSRIKYLINQRNKWIRRFNQSRNPIHKVNRDHFRKLTRDEISTAKLSFYNKQMENLNNPNLSPKKYWSIVHSLCGNKMRRNIPTIVEESITYSTDAEKSELFSEYFANQSYLPPLSENFTLPDFEFVTACKLNIVNFDTAKVLKVISKLNVNKATGPDNISNLILKNTATSLTEPLTKIFNISMRSGIFPEDWKLAHLSPIPKISNPKSKTNFRPISLLSCMSKVMERIIFEEMYQYFMDNNLLIIENSGFKKGDGTVNQLIHIVHNIYKGIDQKHDICMIFLDISKAFDRVYHDGLIFKLKQLGIEGKLLEWLKSYITSRKQKVVLNGQSSGIKTINAGVPQGSILAPLLFLVFVNDITRNINSKIYLYADDTSIQREIVGPQDFETINNDLQTLSNWASQWRVQFNANKTKFIYFSLKRNIPPLPVLYLNNTPIEQIDCHKHLGLTLDSRLEWKAHIENISSRVSKTINSMKRIRWLIPRHTLEIVYKSLVRSVIDYGDIIYSSMSQSLSQKLEKIQRDAALTCTGAIRLTNHEKILKELGWEPLSTRRQNHQLVMFFKMRNQITPNYLSELIPQTISSRRSDLRNRNDYVVPFARTERFKNYFSIVVVKMWNNLPEHAKSHTSLPIFKKYLNDSHGYRFQPLYSLGSHKAKRYHTQIRLGLSGLSQHLHSVNIIDDNTCPLCHLEVETATHYFLRCPVFHEPRARLLASLASLIPLHLLNDDNAIVTGLIFGFHDLDFNKNSEVFLITQDYILNTNRF